MHGNEQKPACLSYDRNGFQVCRTFCEWHVEVWNRALHDRQVTAEAKNTAKTTMSFHVVEETVSKYVG